tara:strand:+ start:14477 stop:15397 length:921 start_codon:yes stop_codon:yes gene_type:complete
MNIITIDYFFKIKNNISFHILDKKVIESIDKLSQLVSAPEYNRTPDFIIDKYRKKKKDNFNNTNNNIEFNVTVIKKNEGLDKEIDSIRILFNKLTDKSYDYISKLIDEKLLLIEKDYAIDDYLKVGNVIFTIMISNIIYSKMYAQLYKDYLNKYNFIKEIILNNIHNFLEYYSEKKNLDLTTKLTFDEISDQNKEIDKKKGQAEFFINLFLYEQITDILIFNLIDNLLELFFEIINLNNKNYLVDQISDIIFIIISKFYLKVKHNEKFENILNSINYISNMKTLSRPSISNKTIFKFMDLKDKIKI